MKLLSTIIALITTLFNPVYSQISLLPIPPEMKENANSVVVTYRTLMECHSTTTGVVKHTKMITILNANGIEHGHFGCYCDNFSSLKKFSGQIIDSSGHIFRKVGKSDLKMNAYSHDLANDSYGYYFECHAPTFPYTILYEWEEEYQNGIIAYPSLHPLEYENQSVINADYTLIVPKSMDCRYKECNVTNAVTRSEDGYTVTIKAKLNDLNAIEKKPYSPDISDIIPRVLFAPTKFTFEGSKGNMVDWNNFGKWLGELQVGRNTLSPEFKLKLRALIDTCHTDKERVKVVYDFLEATTRYVSIQLGIGGLQPIPADKVSALGFGDCKGLTNYMKAILREIGITSYYTVISTQNEKLKHDFASASQMNHVILQVPLPGDTLWVECTAPDLPLGYIHSSIAGHDALLVTENGGKICKLPTYPDTLNKHVIKYDVKLMPTCEATITLQEREYLRKYESSESFASVAPDKQVEILRKTINLIKADISNIKITKEKLPIPVLHTNYNIATNQFGKSTANRMFLPVNIYRSKRNKYDCKGRTTNICIDGELLCDTISINIPQGYIIESMPKPIEINAPFGTFRANYTVTDSTILITQRFQMRKGEYPPAMNNEFATMYNKAIKCYNDKIILLKQ